MDPTTHLPDAFSHVRLILGFVVSLSLARLLTGLARFVQHPTKYKPDLVHLGWVFSTLLLLVHFWWWEFWLSSIRTWTFPIYAFLLAFAFLLFLSTAILFPDDVSEYGSYGAYFMERRAWFFGLLAAIYVFDVVDTLIKGQEHANQYGIDYWIQAPTYIVLSVVAVFWKSRTFQLAFVSANLLYQIFFIARAFNVLV
jgi:hypothetical protein